MALLQIFASFCNISQKRVLFFIKSAVKKQYTKNDKKTRQKNIKSTKKMHKNNSQREKTVLKSSPIYIKTRKLVKKQYLISFLWINSAV